MGRTRVPDRDVKEDTVRKLAMPGMAAFAVAAVLLGWWLAGRLAAWMLGQDAEDGLGLYLRYVEASGLPEWRPFAARIWLAGALGFALPLLAWGVVAWRCWPRRSADRPHARFADPRDVQAPSDESGLLVARQGRRDVRVHGPVLLARSPQAAPDIAVANLLSSHVSAVVLDFGARCFERTAGWRQAQGQQVYRFDPWAGEGRSHGWNPLADLPIEPSARLAALKDIAAALLPDRKEDERFWISHARNAFVALALYAHESVPAGETPTLGAMASVAVHEASRATFRRLHDTLPRDHGGRHAFALLLAQDDGPLAAIAARLADSLRPFLAPAQLAATSQHDIQLATLTQRPTTLYLTVTPQHLAAAWPLLALFFLRMEHLHAGKNEGLPCLMLMDGVTAFGPVDAYLRTMAALGHERWRWLTVVPSMDWLKRVTSDASLRTMLAAHPTCLVDAPNSPEAQTDYASLLTAFRADAPNPALELQALKPGERLLSDARLPLPLRCRTLRPDRRRTAAPVVIPPLPQGDPMKLPLRLAATVATAAMTAAPAGAMPAPAATPASATSSAKPYKWEGYSDKPVEAKLGPYRFRFPMNMYYDQMGPDFQGGVVLVLQWPSLEPYPPGENFHSTTERFLAAVRINLSYLDRIPDKEYPNTLRRSMQRFDTSNPANWLNPSNNIDLRLTGAPVYGLTPYYLDLPRLKTYYVKRHGEAIGARAAEPDDTFNTDWYLVFDPNDVPVTFIQCAPKQVPDGVIVQGDRVQEDPKVRGVTSCTHEFLVPEYKLAPEVSYSRAFLKDWQRIEKHVRDLLHQSLTPSH